MCGEVVINVTEDVTAARYPGGSAAADTDVDEAFRELVYADGDLLRAAFEAIIDAE